MSSWNPLDACTTEQRDQLAEYERLLLDWNARVNLISRTTDSAVVFERHILHSLALAEHSFPDDCAVAAIEDMASQLRLTNVHVHHTRAEKWRWRAHYAVSRATAPLDALWRWYERSRIVLDVPFGENDWMPGLLCLKGGDLRDEIAVLAKRRPMLCIEETPLKPLLGPAYFDENVRLHVTDPAWT